MDLTDLNAVIMRRRRSRLDYAHVNIVLWWQTFGVQMLMVLAGQQHSFDFAACLCSFHGEARQKRISYNNHGEKEQSVILYCIVLQLI